MVLASLSRLVLVVVLVRMDDGARELPVPLVPDLLVPLLVVSALLDALESLASLASIWDLEYMTVRDLPSSLSDPVCLNLSENFFRNECTEGESAMQKYQETSWKELILEQLSRHFMCRGVNKERLRHDTHLEISQRIH